jgi:hypothetical protein
MDAITVINDTPETPQRASGTTTTTELTALSTDQLTPARTHTPVKILTPPRPTETQDTVDIPIGTHHLLVLYLPLTIGHPTGEQEPWMGPVRFGPATRGDMELLSLYLTTPRSTKGSQVNTPLGNQFITKNVSGVMDTFYRTLQEAIFIPLHDTDDPSMFLMTEDWMSKLGDSERLLLESLKRFILHTAIYCARGAPTNFAFPRTNEKGDLEASRRDRVDCLKDFVTDVIVLTKWLKDSCETPEGEPLPSLKEFIQKRISKLDSLAKEGKRDKRRYFFRPNALRSTHEYCRKACCVILGLVDDYDQFPEYGLTDWDKRVLVFDNIEQLIWKGFGLKFKTDRQELKGLTGSIVDLDASFIATGPFTFVKTRRVQEHLTLSKEREIRIYSSPVLGLTAYMFQAHSIGRYSFSSTQRLYQSRSLCSFSEFPFPF